MLQRLIVPLAVSLFTLACQGALPEGPAQPGGVLAVNVEQLQGGLRTAELLPAVLEVGMHGQTVALIQLNGLPPEGSYALALPHDVPTELRLRLRAAEGAVEAEARLGVQADAAQIVLITPSLVRGAGLDVRAETFQLLPDTELAVDFVARSRAAQTVAPAPDEPARAVGAILRDPQVAAVTPFSELPSPVDALGALVPAPRPTSALAPSPATKLHTPPAAPRPALTPPGSRIPPPNEAEEEEEKEEPPASDPALPEHLFLSYYSYCSCGKPVRHHPYTATLADGTTIRGRTDLFGMIVLRLDQPVKRLDYGRGQRPRPRTYVFERGSEATHRAVLAALESADFQVQLTALLDLRREPLEAARPRLIAMLEAPEQHRWLNAAVTLGFYRGNEELVASHLARLRDPGQDQIKETLILGALRHPMAARALLDELEQPRADLRQMAAWALGMLSHGRAFAPLRALLSDPVPAVRAEAALALGRLRSMTALGTLLDLQADPEPEVAERATEALDVLLY